MVQNYITLSNQFLQFGTDKAFPELWGDYLYYGPNRIIEGTLDLTGAGYPAGAISTTSTTPTIISNTEIFPAMAANYLYIEKIEVTAEIATASGTSWNLGLIQMNRSTIPAGYGTGLISGEVAATFANAGMTQTYYQNTTHAGSLIGTGPTLATGPYLLTAYTTGTFTTGQLKVRIHWHYINPVGIKSNITQ